MLLVNRGKGRFWKDQQEISKSVFPQMYSKAAFKSNYNGRSQP